MKAVIVLALVAAVAADVSHLRSASHNSGDANAEITKYEAEVRPDGYNYNYETSNGIAAGESGQLKNINRDEAAVSAQGYFQYYSPEGESIQLSYLADENGYQPSGAHLPTVPPTQPIPPLIQRALEYNAAHPEQNEPQQRPIPRRF